MKNGAWVFTVLFLISSGTSFGDGSSDVKGFSDYLNSPDGSSQNAVNEEINPPPAVHHEEHHEAQHEAQEDQGKADVKPVPQGIPAKWQGCMIDSDCTSGAADCVTWEPINKKYLKNLAKDLRSCSESIDPGFQPQAVCIAKMCRTTTKTTDVSWDEWLGEMNKMNKRRGQ